MASREIVTERDATGETERIFHEIRQSLRVTGINLIFRKWAAHEAFFAAAWEELQPNVVTRAFEEASDRIRAEAVREAAALQRLGAWDLADLGESQRYQIRAALALYHYVNPKLLVIACAVGRALRGEGAGGAGGPGGLVLRGAPDRMAAMEMVAEKPRDRRLRKIFHDIVHTLGLSRINSDYRTLALWPDYLEVAWAQLKPVTREEAYRRAADRLRASADRLAAQLPFPVELSGERIGGERDALIQLTSQFEQLLPALILNIALLAVDAGDPARLEASPFPAPPAGAEVHA